MNFGKIASGGLSGLAASFGGSLLDIGTNLIGSKYASDLQGHQIDAQNQYNRDMATEMFNKQVVENQRVFGQNVARENEVWEKNKALANEMFEKEKAYNLELWQKTNEYNTPKAQMQRLKEAGLNPALMYTQGNVGNSTTISPARIEKPELHGSELKEADARYTPSGVVDQGQFIMQGLQNYYRMRQVSEMTKNMDAQRTLTVAQARKTNAEALIAEHDAGLLGDTGSSKDLGAWWSRAMRGEKWLYSQGKKFGEYLAGKAKRYMAEGRITDPEPIPLPMHIDEIEPVWQIAPGWEGSR